MQAQTLPENKLVPWNASNFKEKLFRQKSYENVKEVLRRV